MPTKERMCAFILFPRMYEWYMEKPVVEEVDRRIDLIFDQNEAFRGHILGLWNNKRFKRRYPAWNVVRSVSEADYRKEPALEIVDMVAWSMNHLGLNRDGEWTNVALRIKTAMRVRAYPVDKQRLLNDPYIEPRV